MKQHWLDPYVDNLTDFTNARVFDLLRGDPSASECARRIFVRSTDVIYKTAPDCTPLEDIDPVN